jgi:hypothetical protein
LPTSVEREEKKWCATDDRKRAPVFKTIFFHVAKLNHLNRRQKQRTGTPTTQKPQGEAPSKGFQQHFCDKKKKKKKRSVNEWCS